MQKVSQNHTDHQSYIEKDQRRQEFSTLNRSTPLHFALRINGQFYISYEKNQFWMIVLRCAAWLIINIFIIIVLNNAESVGKTQKAVISYALIAQNVFYTLLCFLDPGTLSEDEDDSHSQQRTLCMTCSIYKLRTSRHCIWCNKCVQRYDHHCSVFGKCIAGRNLLLFYAFIILSGLQMPALIYTLISSLMGQSQ